MINWSLLGPPPDIAGSFNQGVRMGQALVARRRTENALRAYLTNPSAPDALNALAVEDPDLAYRYSRIEGQRAETASKLAAKQRKAALGQQFLTDPTAARNAAIGAGDFDIAGEFDKLDDAGKKQTGEFFKTATPLAYDLLKMPKEQRAAAYEAAKPMLLATGADPATVNSFDPTDDAKLSAVVSMGETLASKIDRNTPDIRSLEPGGGLYSVDKSGNVRELLRPNTGGAAFGAPVTPTSATRTVAAGNIKAPTYAQQTSGYRDPEHNRRVGGVEGSFHTKKDAVGNPLARDFVPTGGQSMVQLEADLRAQNPGMDVINEGDHVHVEPGSGAANENDIRAKAREAIAAGADPAAVRARAQSMGVSL